MQLSKQAAIPDLPSCVPEIVSPAPGVLMDNGRTDSRDTIDWTFDWTDCPGASQYEITVYGPTGTIPLFRAAPTQSSFRYVDCGSYIISPQLANWRLWLRAKSNNLWGRWSPQRNFDVERPDSDPLFNCR